MGNTVYIPEILSQGFSFGFGVSSVIILIVLLVVNALAFNRFYLKGGKEKRVLCFGILSFIFGILLSFAADLFSIYVFLLLLCTSLFIECAKDRGEESYKRAYVMVLYEVLGSMIMLMGIFLTKHSIETLDALTVKEAFSNGTLPTAAKVLLCLGLVIVVVMALLNVVRASLFDKGTDAFKLKGFFGCLDWIMDLALTILAFVGRVFDKVTDAIVYVLSHTILSMVKMPKTGRLFGLMRSSGKDGKVMRSIFNSLSFSFFTFAGTLVIILIYILAAR